MLEAVWEGLLHLGRWLFGYLIWRRVLFHLGRGTLWLLSLRRWRGHRAA